MKIDLRKYWLPLQSDIERSLGAFTQRCPNIEICTVGLYGDGFHGFAGLYIDTQAHSAEFIRQWAGCGSVLEDTTGRYCSNCPDFAYGLDDFPFPDYPDLYEHDPKNGLT